jgi:hypothetical protein
LVGKHNSIGTKRTAGYDNEDSYGNRYFYVNANNDIEVPELIDYKSVIMNKDPQYIHPSPADYAYVKLLVEMGERVLDYMDKDSGYDDGKGEEIKKAKQPDKWGYKDKREEKEKQREKIKGQLTMAPDKASLYDDIQKLQQERSQLIKSKGDRDKISKLSKDIKLLKAKYDTI